MNRFQREAFHSVTDLSSDERSNVNLSTKSSPRRRSSPADVMTPKSTQKTTPRGATAILASQIDQEILELRSFYEQHRSEMLSLAATATGAAAATPFVQNRSTAVPQSVDTQDKQTSMMMKSPTKYSRPLVNRGVVNIESESDNVSFKRNVFRNTNLTKVVDSSNTKNNNSNRTTSKEAGSKFIQPCHILP